MWGDEAVSLGYFVLCNMQKVKAAGRRKEEGTSEEENSIMGGVSSTQKEQDSDKSWELCMQIRLSLGKRGPFSKSSCSILLKGKIANNYWSDFPLS